MVKSKLVKVDGEWVREVPAPSGKEVKKEKRVQKSQENHGKRQDMQFLSKGLLPPTELKSFLDRSQDPARGGKTPGPGKKQGHLLRVKGASCVGNLTTDEHVATVVSRSKAMIVELRGIDARLTFLGEKGTRDADVLKEEQKLEKKRHLLKSRLDRTVQTLQIAEYKILTVPTSTIGVVLWATFGAPGKDQSDVTSIIERSVERGGIDGLQVNLQTLGAHALGSAGVGRVLSIIYIGKAHEPILNKVHLGFSWTPRFEPATPRQTLADKQSVASPENVKANLQEFTFEGMAEEAEFFVPERQDAAAAAKSGLETWLSPISDGLMSALCFVSPDSRTQRELRYDDDDEDESDWDEEDDEDEWDEAEEGDGGGQGGGGFNVGSWFEKDASRSFEAD